MIKRVFASFLMMLFALSLSAQDWVVPADLEARLSPFVFSDSTHKAGEEIYNLNCKSCHGDPGKNNVINLVPPPPDPASDKMQKDRDGALFYKVYQGRGLMPSFKNTLSTSDIWHVISYVRTFNEKYVQEVSIAAGPVAAIPNVNINLKWVAEKKQVEALVTYLKDQALIPLAGVEVKLFVKRYFGNLLIDEAKSSNDQGQINFNFPEDLPGDSTGKVMLIAKFSDPAAFGEKSTDTTLAIGVPTYLPPLNAQRAMWNVVQKTPIWLLLTYGLSVLAVWGLIFYVLLQIRKIHQNGRLKNQDHKSLK